MLLFDWLVSLCVVVCRCGCGCVSLWLWSCVVVVVVVVVCAVWCGTLKTPVCRFKTPPCVHSKRPRVYQHHVHMGGVLNLQTGEGGRVSSPVLLTKNGPRRVSTCPRGSPKVTTGCYPLSLRIGREQHVPDSSSHSLYLMKLLGSSYPEGNVGGNQL